MVGKIFKYINTFFQQGNIKIIKSDSQDFYILFQINTVLFNFLFILI